MLTTSLFFKDFIYSFERERVREKRRGGEEQRERQTPC